MNLVDPFDVSAQIGWLEEPDADGARVRVRTIGTAPSNPSSVVDHIGKGRAQPVVSPRAKDDELAEIEAKICSLAHQLRASSGVPATGPLNVSPTFSAHQAATAEAWVPTPSLRRPGDPLSNGTKFLIASATAALAGYYVFASSDRAVDVAVAPQPAIGMQDVESLSLQEAEASSAKGRGVTVESGAEPAVQTASSEPTARLEIQPTESGIDARLQQTRLQEGGKQLFAASGRDFTCFPSASAVRQNHPGAWPSWTLRAPGYEGTRCWYAATRTRSEADGPSAKAMGLTIEDRAERVVQTGLPLDIKPTGSWIDTRPPQTLPERGAQLVAASRHDCLPSAAAVRQSKPEGWPSWTLRAPGHEGIRCWHATTRTAADDHQSEMTPRRQAVGTAERLGSPGGSLQ
jgi:hypothetical protein